MPFDPLSIVAPYDELEFIQKLNAYDSCKGTDEMLDLMREVQTSGNYYWQGVVFPGSSDLSVASQTTVNGTIQVPPGSYITGINYYSSNNAGIKFKLYDKGTKASIFYGDYALDRLVASNMQIHYGQGSDFPPSDLGSNLDNPFGTGLLMNPLIVTPPGILGWEIVNLATAANTVQVLLCVAVPISNQSIGTKIVGKVA